MTAMVQNRADQFSGAGDGGRLLNQGRKTYNAVTDEKEVKLLQERYKSENVIAGTRVVPVAKEEKYEDETTKIKLTWEDFNANYDSNCPSIEELTEIFKFYPEKVIDLNPYMWRKPYRVFLKDSIDMVNSLFRHMDLRSLPVLAEKDHTLMGIITR